MYEVGRVFPRHVQRTCLTGESPLSHLRVAHTLQLYNYLLRFYLTLNKSPAGILILFILKLNKTIKLYIDYRGFNKIIIKNYYLLLLVNKILN